MKMNFTVTLWTHTHENEWYGLLRKQRKEIRHSIPNSSAWTPTLQVPAEREFTTTEQTQILQLSDLLLKIEVTPEPKSESYAGRQRGWREQNKCHLEEGAKTMAHQEPATLTVGNRYRCLDIVGTVYHLVIYMQSNKIHSVVFMSEF